MNVYKSICGAIVILCLIFDYKYLGIIIVSINTSDSIMRVAIEIKSRYNIRKAIKNKKL